MSKIQKAQLDYSLYVKCPDCGDSFDLLYEDYCSDADAMTRPLFNNIWDDAYCTATCPECDCEFEVKGIEY